MRRKEMVRDKRRDEMRREKRRRKKNRGDGTREVCQEYQTHGHRGKVGHIEQSRNCPAADS
jgi:hypothetical protein